jgi:hypothetical protein
MNLWTDANQPHETCTNCGRTEFDSGPVVVYPTHKTAYGWSIGFRNSSPFCDRHCLVEWLTKTGKMRNDAATRIEWTWRCETCSRSKRFGAAKLKCEIDAAKHHQRFVDHVIHICQTQTVITLGNDQDRQPRLFAEKS